MGRETTGRPTTKSNIYFRFAKFMHDSTYILLNKAFRILRRNYGCPGNDKLSIKDIKNSYEHYIDRLKQDIESTSYNFEACPKSIMINDSFDRERKIFVYNVLERWVQHYLKLHIDPLISSVLSEYVYAYRRGSTDTESYKYILRNESKYVLRLDIKNYFGAIDKDSLFKLLTEVGVNKEILTLTKDSYSHHKIGLPAGHVLSCTLSNLYLKDFDYRFPYIYTRYSDDMMFALNTRDEVENTIRLVEQLLSGHNLKLNTNKTRIVLNPTIEKLK